VVVVLGSVLTAFLYLKALSPSPVATGAMHHAPTDGERELFKFSCKSEGAAGLFSGENTK